MTRSSRSPLEAGTARGADFARTDRLSEAEQTPRYLMFRALRWCVCALTHRAPLCAVPNRVVGPIVGTLQCRSLPQVLDIRRRSRETARSERRKVHHAIRTRLHRQVATRTNGSACQRPDWRSHLQDRDVARPVVGFLCHQCRGPGPGRYRHVGQAPRCTGAASCDSEQTWRIAGSESRHRRSGCRCAPTLERPFGRMTRRVARNSITRPQPRGLWVTVPRWPPRTQVRQIRRFTWT